MRRLLDKLGQADKDALSLVGKQVQIQASIVRCEAAIGEGGYASIYRCRDERTGNIYALKHIRLGVDGMGAGGGGSDSIAEIQQEAIVMAKLSGHKNILSMHAIAFAGAPVSFTSPCTSPAHLGWPLPTWLLQALGVLLYVLVFGKLPFPGDSKLSVLFGKYELPAGHNKPQVLCDLVRILLTTDPAQRPDIVQVLSLLESWRKALTQQAMGHGSLMDGSLDMAPPGSHAPGGAAQTPSSHLDFNALRVPKTAGAYPPHYCLTH
ncbi:protein kinase domain-containing protein [Haematococcus lacustris]|uniref:non-specific serine/threonine protein kinase n=1 Tax=Haematococcus lacustris TaxID=44745 RepID=A0A6A0A208_HAELA|nr:protein kinase domain-containing protein [Haematococcus lacustris]